MALTSYLGATLICTTLFNGYGFGLFGSLRRHQLYLVVLGDLDRAAGVQPPVAAAFSLRPGRVALAFADLLAPPAIRCAHMVWRAVARDAGLTRAPVNSAPTVTPQNGTYSSAKRGVIVWPVSGSLLGVKLVQAQPTFSPHVEHVVERVVERGGAEHVEHVVAHRR